MLERQQSSVGEQVVWPGHHAVCRAAAVLCSWGSAGATCSCVQASPRGHRPDLPAGGSSMVTWPFQRLRPVTEMGLGIRSPSHLAVTAGSGVSPSPGEGCERF